MYKVRDAAQEDYEEIFMMGADIWSEGMSKSEYLDSCFKSPKYNRGKWKVLDDGKRLLSSLIVYDLGKRWFGIGSLATPPHLRRQGLAKKIIIETSLKIEQRDNAKAIFIFSDIGADYYQ